MAQLTDQWIQDTFNTAQAGRDQDAVEMGRQVGNPWLKNIAESYQQIFGRLPTVQEVAQATPAFSTMAGSGESFISQLYQQQNPYGGAEKNATGQYDTVNSIFQQTLGRDATDEEKKHFGTLIAAKQYDPYTLGQALQNLPENVRKKDEEFRKSLTGELQASDARYYNEQIMPGIARNFAQQGRSFDSSAYAQALAQAAQGQNRQRESFLSNLTAQQYEGNKSNAYNEYLNNFNYTRNRANALTDQTTQRLYDFENYNFQKSAYDQYLKRYGKRSSAYGGIGGLVGAGIGAAFAAPTGGMSIPAGALLGSTLGQSGGSIFDYYGR